MWKLPDDDLEALIRSFERSDWREMRLQMEGVELILAKDAEPQWRTLPIAQQNARQAEPAQPSAPAQEAVAPAAAKQKAPGAVPEGWLQVRAPSLGTFYRAPKPGSPPFVCLRQCAPASRARCGRSMRPMRNWWNTISRYSWSNREPNAQRDGAHLRGESRRNRLACDSGCARLGH